MRRTWMVVVAAVLSVGGLARYEYVAFKAQNERIGMQSYALTQFAGRMDLLERGVGRAENTADAVQKDLSARNAMLENEATRVARNVAAFRTELTAVTMDVDALGGRLTTELTEATHAHAVAVGAATAYGERVVHRVRALEVKLAEVKKHVETLGNASDEVDVLHTALDSVSTDVSAMYASLHRDPMEKLRAMVIPTVQIACGNEVGSGVIVWSGRRGKSGVIHTYVLTAYHVLGDIPPEPSADAVPETAPVPIGTQCTVKYDVTGRWEDPKSAEGQLVIGDPARDLALVRLDLDFEFPSIATIASPHAAARLQVFAPVYALGCPLGYSPMPTWGELATKRKVLKGRNHWMITAPTIFGNSGGGIFTADAYELIGVLSRVSAYNNFINVAVPHMGILVPIDVVHEWLEDEGYAFVAHVGVGSEEEERGAVSVPTASAKK